MAIENIVFRPDGYVEVTGDGGRKTATPVTARLAQVVMALIKVLIESDIIDDEPGQLDCTLQSLLDILVDNYGADLDGEGRRL
jgi:hypothetical protein